MIICHFCRKKIVDEEYARVGTSYFHLKHFNCFHCQKSLLGDKDLRELNHKVYCPDCYLLVNQPDCHSCG